MASQRTEDGRYFTLSRGIDVGGLLLHRQVVYFVTGVYKSHPPIAPPDFRQFLQHESVRRVYAESDALVMQTRQLCGWGYSMAVPRTWESVDAYSFPSLLLASGRRRVGFARKLRSGFLPFVVVTQYLPSNTNCYLATLDTSNTLANPNKYCLRPLNTRYERMGGLSSIQIGEWHGEQSMLSVTSPVGQLVGWNVGFKTSNALWLMVFATHPACLAVDSVLFGRMLESLTQT
jgi:hypothetical protein